MGNIGSDLIEISKKIAVIRHVGIRKTKLISSPIQKDDDIPIPENQDITDADKELIDNGEAEGPFIENAGIVEEAPEKEQAVETSNNNSEMKEESA
jgi:hypothetical protein